MYYKPDWEQVKKRLEAFWNNEILDRCCIAICSPRKSSKWPSYATLQTGPWIGELEKFNDDDVESIKKWWVDPEENYRRTIDWMENTYFGGEALPVTSINWGAMAMAAFYGSKPVFTKKTVWYPPVIKDWDTWEWNFNEETNEYWTQIKRIIQYFIERDNGDYFIGMPEFGTPGDVLSLLRGMDKLCIDLIEYPEKVKEAIDILGDTWIKLHEEIYTMTFHINDGGAVLAWMSLWAPGRIDQLACDFSSLISPEMFKEFFVQEIEKLGGWTEYGMYHLDGPACMNNHLDTLLGVSQIKAIEYTPGEGSPPTFSPQYIPKYKKIQASGKRLYLLAEINEVELILNELSPKGLFISTHADSEDEAKELLRRVGKWSVKRRFF